MLLVLNVLLIGAFYFTIGNMPPKYRSRLSSIHLVALVKAKFIGNYGMDLVLKPFVSDMKKLVCNAHVELFISLLINTLNTYIGKGS